MRTLGPRQTTLAPEDHLLEIGTGWGSMALYAAQHYGCKVTTTTLSKEQFDYTQARRKALGLQDQVTLLLEDYRDYLRVRDLVTWEKDSKEAQYVRKLGGKPHTTYETYRTYVDTRSAEVVANIAICLIHQANYLLDQQIRRLEQDFLKDGGLRERMTKARLQAREQQRRDERRR